MLAAAPEAPAVVQEPQISAERSSAYDNIDRFLRNNLDDEDYATFSRDLEAVFSAPEAPALASAVDERAAFEAWWNENGLGPLDFQWESWQARAALAQKGGAA